MRAITSDLPYEHKSLCTLAYLGLAMSGRVHLASDPYLQPRFYSCMIGSLLYGQERYGKEVRRLMTRTFPEIHVEFSIDWYPHSPRPYWSIRDRLTAVMRSPTRSRKGDRLRDPTTRSVTPRFMKGMKLAGALLRRMQNPSA